jgi:hypothetical protein
LPLQCRRPRAGASPWRVRRMAPARRDGAARRRARDRRRRRPRSRARAGQSHRGRGRLPGRRCHGASAPLVWVGASRVEPPLRGVVPPSTTP